MPRPAKPKARPAAPQPAAPRDQEPEKVPGYIKELSTAKMKSIIDMNQEGQIRQFPPYMRNPSVQKHFEDFYKKYRPQRRKR